MHTKIRLISFGFMLVFASTGCDVVKPLPDSRADGVVVEVAAFEGGYGIHWHQKVATQYSALNVERNASAVVWGDPRVSEKVKPRILRGDPPNLILDNRIPIWLMIATEKLAPFDSELDKPAWGLEQENVTWREMFAPGMLDIYEAYGKVYAIPTSYGAWGCWYNARLFREHGWETPKTWSEFEVLCQKILDAGISPIAYQGKYPYYGWYTYFSLLHRCGGLAAINRANGCEPGAYSHPDAIWAARLMQEMSQRYFQKGALAMNHTESQLEFVNDNAALIFCGVWLENEMKSSTPPDFEMRCFTVPGVEGGKGNPLLFNGQGMEYVFASSDAPNLDEALRFCNYMMSRENGPDMANAISVISPIKGAAPREALSPALQSVLDIIDASPSTFSDRVSTLLLEWFNQVMQPCMSALLSGEITPEEFGRRMDAGIEASRQNPDVIIPPFRAYDGAKYGEPVS